MNKDFSIRRSQTLQNYSASQNDLSINQNPFNTDHSYDDKSNLFHSPDNSSNNNNHKFNFFHLHKTINHTVIPNNFDFIHKNYVEFQSLPISHVNEFIPLSDSLIDTEAQKSSFSISSEISSEIPHQILNETTSQNYPRNCQTISSTTSDPPFFNLDSRMKEKLKNFKLKISRTDLNQYLTGNCTKKGNYSSLPQVHSNNKNDITEISQFNNFHTYSSSEINNEINSLNNINLKISPLNMNSNINNFVESEDCMKKSHEFNDPKSDQNMNLTTVVNHSNKPQNFGNVTNDESLTENKFHHSDKTNHRKTDLEVSTIENKKYMTFDEDTSNFNTDEKPYNELFSDIESDSVSLSRINTESFNPMIRGGSFSHSSYPFSMSVIVSRNIIYDDLCDVCGHNDIKSVDITMRMRLAFLGMIFMSILCNYDHGAIPASLGDIIRDFPIGYIEQSLLGSLVYFGLIIGTLIAGFAFQKFKAKWLLVSSLCGLSFCLYFFSISNSLNLLYMARFFCGIFQAMPVVYLPVWVDNFAPENEVARWMSYTQLASIGGSVIGYLLGGIVSHHGPYRYGVNFFQSWRFPFFLQSILLIPSFLLLSSLPSNTINVDTDNPRRPTKQNSGFFMATISENPLPLNSNSFDNMTLSPRSYSGGYSLVTGHERHDTLISLFSQIKSLLNNPLYVIITFSLSNLYFVVTGIQFWITEYMIIVLHYHRIVVVSFSTICFLTAPTSGVWFGGYICDLFGGYRGDRIKTACRVATVFAGLAASFAILATQIKSIILFASSLWICMFFGASLVPVSIGMVISSVPVCQRSLSSAISQFAYNIFGWSAAPLLSGIIMDIIAMNSNNNQEYPLKVGFSLILSSSIFGFFLFVLSNYFVSENKNMKVKEVELNTKLSEDIKISMEE